ncbi:hypothetical protein GGI42DRAFT_347248 [Trichoderma sp. SZMC 28013]
MLIARVHVHVQIFQHRGQQYKYRGHVVNFLRDTGSVYSQLPLLPPDLDIIILRPANSTNQPHMTRQFRRQFRVRQEAIRQWLLFLRDNHPGYRDIFIDQDRLSQLPVDGDVSDQLFNHRQPEVIIEDTVADADLPHDDDYDGAAVPNLIAAQTELDQLRDLLENREVLPAEQIPFQQLLHQHSPEPSPHRYIRMPNIRSTPISEFNRSQPLLSLAFPTLYPRGEADFVYPRLRSITYDQYLAHAMKYHDGRFTRYPRLSTLEAPSLQNDPDRLAHEPSTLMIYALLSIKTHQNLGLCSVL